MSDFEENTSDEEIELNQTEENDEIDISKLLSKEDDEELEGEWQVSEASENNNESDSEGESPELAADDDLSEETMTIEFQGQKIDLSSDSAPTLDEGEDETLVADALESLGGDDSESVYESFDSEPEEELEENSSDESNNSFPMQQLITIQAQVEAILFAAEKSIKIPEIIEIIGDEDLTTESIQDVINSLMQFYEERGGGFRLELIRGGGFQFRTVAAAGELMERMFSSRPRPISRAAQETLSIVAYRQPVTRADVEFIRGVDAGSIMKNLLERDLIKCVGRKEDAGRPMLFGTSDEFLRVYQLSSIKDLPPLDSFQPSPEMIEEAADALEGDQQVDIEDFIKDVDKDIDKEDAELEFEGEELDVELSASEDDDEFAEDNEGPLLDSGDGEGSKEKLEVDEALAVEGATVVNEEQKNESQDDFEFNSDEAILEKEEEIDGTDALTEVGLSTRDSVPEGSGEMD